MDLKMYKNLNIKAKKYILKELENKFYQKYDDEDLLKRCYLEIDLLFDKGFLFIIEYLYKFKNKYNKEYYFEGTIDNLLLLYILDITTINPVDYDLPYELFSDTNIKVSLVDEQPLLLCWYLENKLQGRIKVICGRYRKSSEINCLTNYYLLVPYDYFEAKQDTEFALKEFYMFETVENYKNYDDKFLMLRISQKESIYSGNILTSEFENKIANILKPKTIKDYINIKCLAHGTNIWNNNQEKLVKQGKINLDELITNREDVYEYLLNHSISKELALEITTFIRKGLSKMYPEKWENYAEIMKQNNCDNMTIEIFSRVDYLINRGTIVRELLFISDNIN